MGSSGSFSTTADATHQRMLSTSMQGTKKIDFQIDETDENCLSCISPIMHYEEKPPRHHHRKKSSVISNLEVDSLVKRLFKYEQDRLEKIKMAKK